MTANPFRQKASAASQQSGTNRGGEFTIRSNGEAFVGRAVNLPFVRHLLNRVRTECGEAIASVVGEETKSLRDTISEQEKTITELAARLTALEVADSLKQKSVAKFATKRRKPN